jgi:hypothetical protein
MIVKVIWMTLLLATFSVNGLATSKVDEGAFFCVQPRAKSFFVVRGVLADDQALDTLTIRRLETQAQDGLRQKTIWEESVAPLSPDPTYSSISSYWSESSPYRIEDQGKIAEATLFLPQDLLGEPEPASVTRSRLKIRMKTGEVMDVRLHCART